MLPELIAGVPCVFPACAFGDHPMAEMVRGGLFVRGFPPDNADHLGLEIDGEISEFCVYRVRGEFHCEEVRDANPRHLRYSEEELTMHTLSRARFYECVAKDLGVTGQVIDLGHGIWELGRKRLPGRDSSKVIFIEDGVPAAVLELALMRDEFTVFCLLHHEKPPMHDWHADKTLVSGVIEVRDGRYSSDVFEDLSASQRESSAETHIELEEQPPKLWICGEEFLLPTSFEGIPTDGCRYLAYLFDQGISLLPAGIYTSRFDRNKRTLWAALGGLMKSSMNGGNRNSKRDYKKRGLNSRKRNLSRYHSKSWRSFARQSTNFKSRPSNFSITPVEAIRLSRETVARPGNECARR